MGNRGKYFFGSGPVRVCVLAQILPHWPERAFFENILRPLGTRFRFTIWDPLAGVSARTTFGSLVRSYSRRLDPKRWDLFLGFSLGGSILQKLASRGRFADSTFALVSTPSRITPRLRKKLESVLEALEQDGLEAGERKLNRLTGATRQSPRLDSTAAASRRLKLGLRVFLSQPANHRFASPTPRLLYLLGESSRLVTSREVHLQRGIRLESVRGAGMRVFSERPEICSALITRFLEGAP